MPQASFLGCPVLSWAAMGGGGVEGPKLKNSLEDNFVSLMILQGVEHPKSYIGVCYANTPQKGGGRGWLSRLQLI